MLVTEYGTFDGDSWESACQLIFKRKYGKDNYQEMPASPGDFGIEGIIRDTGVAIQCYCPDKNYTKKELYEKQRNKITTDLNKLKEYETHIKERLGDQKIAKWIFLTPEINSNDLLRHATIKAKEIQSWGLEILDDNVQVLVQDAGFYASELRDLEVLKGNQISFIPPDFTVMQPTDPQQLTDYEANISRKNTFRCIDGNGAVNSRKHEKLNERTGSNWLNGDTMLKKIEQDAAEVYYKLERCFSQFEIEVEELCITWQGTANELFEKVKSELSVRIAEAVPELSSADRYSLANSMVSRWIAICPLEFES
nr:hypothetical protein [uncultured Halomonas sp.]